MNHLNAEAAKNPDALFLDQDAAFEHAKHPDTPENFTAVWQPISDRMAALAVQFRKPFLPVVAFFLGSGNYLAHTRNLDTLLKAIAAQSQPTIRPVVMLMGTADDKVKAMPCDIYQFPVGGVKTWLEIQKVCRMMNVQAFVHVSTPQNLAFAAGIRCGQKHIWWSHKWHGLKVPGVNGYLSATMGMTPPGWKRTFTALPDMFDRTKTADAKKIRAGLQFKTIFGTLCREEKISIEYIQLVAQIVAKTPDSVYIYAGRKQVDALDNIGGVFIGWVDTGLWAQVIDVFLDTFPFHSGHTAWEAVAAGKPVVSMEPPMNCEQAFIPTLSRDCGIEPVTATTAAEYVTNATNGATLAEMTQRQYAAYLKMQDVDRMARSVSDAIMEVIRQ